mgnify:CR=1 FL=1
MGRTQRCALLGAVVAAASVAVAAAGRRPHHLRPATPPHWLEEHATAHAAARVARGWGKQSGAAAPSVDPAPSSGPADDRFVAVTLSPNGSCVYWGAVQEGTVAVASYTNWVNVTGWGVLTVSVARSGVRPADAAFAAGCAEAAVTYAEMWAYWSNYGAAEYGPAGPSPALQTFMTDQLAWVRSQVAAAAARGVGTPVRGAPAADIFWGGMALALAQFDGLAYTFSAAAGVVPAAYAMNELALHMLNSVGDLEDLDRLYPNTGPVGYRRSPTGFDPIPVSEKLTDCSAFITITGDGRDVVAGHTTWRSYYAMLRIYKVYFLPYTAAGVVSFSSSPGLLHSKVRRLVVFCSGCHY